MFHPFINRSLRCIARAVSAAAIAVCTLPALAAIPASERQVLIDLYNSAHGDAWVDNVNWMSAAGTECTWSGVVCDPPQTHVVEIRLPDNHLIGSLPASLNHLTALHYFAVNKNQLTGSIPSLRGLTALQDFGVDNNQLTGSIPSLCGLTALQNFYVGANQLTGRIPALCGLKKLKDFFVGGNQLTGPIPSLRGLTALEKFIVSRNQLTGIPPAAPASLIAAGLMEMEGYVGLCPNYLSTPSPTEAAWNKLINGKWSDSCTSAPTYTANASAGAGGSISPASQSGKPGVTPSFTIKPDAGMVVDQVSSTCGQPSGQPALVTSSALGKFTAAPLIADCTITASFKVKTAQQPAQVDVLSSTHSPIFSTTAQPEQVKAARPTQGVIPATERQALIDLYNSTNGTAWHHHDHWLGAVGTECTWFGVVCDAGQTHVVKITLYQNDLAGSLPASLNHLAALKIFDASYNKLTGNIPALDGLTTLRLFNVSDNQLTGTIPSLSGLTALQIFDAHYNKLTGNIPALDGLTTLRLFSVSDNQLTGTIPSLSGLTALEYFYVSHNKLTGTIPSLSGLTALLQLRAYENQLTGSIPPLEGLTALVRFEVAENQLTGSIPPLDGLTALKTFQARDNQLTGNIPALNGLTALEEFYVPNNRLTGSIPSLSGLKALQDLYVNDNQLTGSVPSLSELSALAVFDAHNNQLTGNLPVLNKRMALFDVHNNQLTGSIPLFGELPSLWKFDVSDNQLTGSIPSLSGLTSGSVQFYVQYNQLTGTPPAAPAKLLVGYPALCPNYLSKPSPTDAEWNAVIGDPWSYRCTAAPTYVARASAGDGGSINPASQSGAPGATPSFTITPDAGMAVDQVSTTCGQPSGQPALLTSGPLTRFTTAPLIADCTVTVRFKAAVVSP